VFARVRDQPAGHSVNRIRPVLPEMIPPKQTGFIEPKQRFAYPDIPDACKA